MREDSPFGQEYRVQRRVEEAGRDFEVVRFPRSRRARGDAPHPRHRKEKTIEKRQVFHREPGEFDKAAEAAPRVSPFVVEDFVKRAPERRERRDRDQEMPPFAEKAASRAE